MKYSDSRGSLLKVEDAVDEVRNGDEDVIKDA